eukprot:5175775-Ditylum_brightwellii.AAC.1
MLQNTFGTCCGDKDDYTRDGCPLKGNLDKGVMAGIEIMHCVPLSRCALQVHPRLMTWLDTCLTDGAVYLSPEDWYGKGHELKGGSVREEGFWAPHSSPGNFIWHPPPAAAMAEVEEVRQEQYNWHVSLHLFVVQMQ